MPTAQVEKWSAVKETSGRNSKCKGCRKAIKAGELCIKHTHKQQLHDKHFTTDQFHIDAKCLLEIRGEHIGSFLEKQWSQKSIQKAQKMVKRMWTETDSESDTRKETK